MADFPEWVENETTPTQPITVAPPAYDANASNAKTREAHLVEQQWRDVVGLGLDKAHPLSINRDSDLVTDDPYTA
jgi:hypothetical protein